MSFNHNLLKMKKNEKKMKFIKNSTKNSNLKHLTNKNTKFCHFYKFLKNIENMSILRSFWECRVLYNKRKFLISNKTLKKSSNFHLSRLGFIIALLQPHLHSDPYIVITMSFRIQRFDCSRDNSILVKMRDIS